MVKFEFSLEKLSIKFEGSQDDLPVVTDEVAGHLGKLLTTTNTLSPAKARPATPRQSLPDDGIIEGRSRRKSISKGPNASGKVAKNSKSKGRPKTQPIQFELAPEKWGFPSDAWNTAKKVLWMMYVIDHSEVGDKRYSTSALAATFNAHFATAGQIRGSHVSRDLKKLQQAKPALVGRDTTQAGQPWYLLEAGIKLGSSLVRECRGLE